ncbi:MAG: class I tRNA ligase family protein [Bacteroidetes bacterium]|nr:class I tRNA ligase family protein [Bacteroidota bacterium]
MIQGRSNLVYRIVLTFNNSKHSDLGLYFQNNPIFISKEFITNDLSLTEEGKNILEKEINQVFEKLISPIGEEILNMDYSYGIIALHVDVNIVQNDILNIESFKKWQRELQNSIILSEDNKCYCGVIDAEKMSKSKFNVVSPDLICEKFGADTLRLYEMFLGPLEQSKPWNTNGITGVAGFLKKLWRLGIQVIETEKASTLGGGLEGASKAELKTLHKTIKKITEDIERFSFNTSVSNFMICVNELTEAKCNKRAILEPLLICLSPYAPHITEELWEKLGHSGSIALAPFPMHNEEYLVDDSFNYPISFNGKMRLNIELPATLTAPEIEKEVMSREEVQKYLEGKTPKKIIVVPKKIVNIVI